MISIEWKDQDGARWIELEGELDHETAPALKEQLDSGIQQTDGDVFVVLGGVSFVASMVIGVLLDARKRLAEKGRTLRLAGIPSPFRTALKLMALDGFFEEA